MMMWKTNFLRNEKILNTFCEICVSGKHHCIFFQIIHFTNSHNQLSGDKKPSHGNLVANSKNIPT